ncbi:MAG: DUF5667 domain-containing protein [Actinomycetota bacterium]
MRDGKTLDEEAFARMLEGAEAPRDLAEARMGALVSALERSQPPTPLNPKFASALRERLVAESAIIREAAIAARVPLIDRLKIRLRAQNDSMRRSFRVVTAAGLAAILLIGSGAILASAKNAIPGQWNYSIKRAEESAHLFITRGPLSRGYLELDLARERLGEIKALADNHVQNQKLYLDTFSDMDSSTVQGSELLINASRHGAGTAPLNRLTSFAVAQRLRLGALVSRIPLGVSSAGRGSMQLLDRIIDRVASVAVGCQCPSNPLELPTAMPAGQANPSAPRCSCSSTTTQDSSGTQTQPDATPSNSGDKNPSQPSNPGAPSPSPTQSGILPSINPTNPAQTTNDVLNKLGISVPPTPLPLPSPTISL